MQSKFVCALAIFAIVAALTFSEADACKHCNYDACSGCGPSYVSIPDPHPIPIFSPPSLSLCQTCSAPCRTPSHYPRQYCSPCLRRKAHRLMSSCSCGC